MQSNGRRAKAIRSPLVDATGGRPASRRPTAVAFLLALAGLLALAVGWPVPVAGTAAVTDPTVVDALERDGRYIEPTAGSELHAAIDRANELDVAFVWLDRPGDDIVASTLADEYLFELQASGRYSTVLVRVASGYAASSFAFDQAELDPALDAAFPSFNEGAPATGVNAFVDELPTGSGIPLGPVLLVILIVGGGFLAIRGFIRRRQAKEQATIDLAEDKAEIEEQLKDNADRVIELGDQVIAKGDRELIVMYEEASATYQDVSQRVDEADSADEIDDLDDQIDHAQWQLEVIEAELEGRPRPRPPTGGLPPTPTPQAPEAPSTGDSDHEPTSDSDSGSNSETETKTDSETDSDSETETDSDRDAGSDTTGSSRPGGDDHEPPVVTSPRTGRSYPRSGSRRRRSGRGGSGGLGGVLADVVLGGGLGGVLGAPSRRTSRRSEQRRGSGSSRGGLGGGVLRRQTSSSRSSGGRKLGKPRSSGGRKLGKPRSSGGRKLGKPRSSSGRKL